jgi:hypothetical protein
MTSGPSPSHRGRFLTANRLYLLLVLCALVGALLPLLSRFMHEAELGHPSWHAFLEGRPGLARVLEEYPALDASRLFPLVEKLPWEAPREPASLRYYKSFVFWTAGYLVLILLLGRRIRSGLEAGLRWLRIEDEQRRARRTVFACVFLLVFCFLTRTPVGFWIPQGIGGWTYEGLRSRLTDELAPEMASAARPTPRQLEALAGCVRPSNAAHLPRTGFLTGIGMLLHFSGGELLPGTYGLLELPKAQYVFGTRYGEIQRSEVFGAIVRDTLSYRRRGMRFLLPLSIGYPNHTAYKLPDYAGYPPPETLERVSFWDIALRIGEGGSAEVETAVLRYAFDV